MQYWKPEAGNEFAGDMMPYWDSERFHLFYLLDRGHHTEQEGLGGHQWAHTSTADLVNWQHHPMAVPIGAPGTYDQHGICTGCIFEHKGVYHAYYATRIKGLDGSITENLCQAEGTDLIHFHKSADNPMFTAGAGMNTREFRDPCVFRDADTGLFHMLVTAQMAENVAENQPSRGALAHYLSQDLKQWEEQKPFAIFDSSDSPECPEHFFWNGWWYLVYSRKARMEYQISRSPLGPWQRARRDFIEGSTLAVPQSAFFADGRCLAAGFLPWRKDDCDAGQYVYAGSVVFREIIQDSEGMLFTRFVPEMMPRTEVADALEGFTLKAGDAQATISLPDTPAESVLSFRIAAEAGTQEYGLLLRTDNQLQMGYRLCFSPHEARVTLRQWPQDNGLFTSVITALEGMDQAVEVVVCMKGSLVDICVNNQRTMIERCFDHRGTTLAFFVQQGAVSIENLQILPIL